MIEILYRSPALEVRRVATGDGHRQVVTFDSYHEPAGFERPGFGEAFFQSENITAIHVMSHGNDWFQHAELKHVLALIRRATEGAERLMAYGSSMGGYAAVRCAGAIGAQVALALSPQFSLDPRRAPFERRWVADQRRIRFLRHIDGAFQPASETLIAYDPALAPDRQHAELIAREIDVTSLPLPHAGHPVGGFLSDAGLLRSLALGALDGTFEAERFLADAHRRRSRSAHWLANLAEAQPTWRHRCSIGLSARAVTLAPDHASLHAAHARCLARAGRFEEAVGAHRQAIAREPIVDYLWGLSQTLHASGDLTAALDVAGKIRRLAPATAGYHAWAARLYRQQGKVGAMRAALRRAVRHDPGNRVYRWQLLLASWRGALQRVRRLFR